METYSIVEIFSIPMLYSERRIGMEELPEGFYRYELRGSDYDSGLALTIEESVTVNFVASVLSPIKIDKLSDGGWLYIDINFLGYELTLNEYADEFDVDDIDMEQVEFSIGIENELQLLSGFGGKEDRYIIYQVNKDTPSGEGQFMNLHVHEKLGIPVCGYDYGMFYTGKWSNDMVLERLYCRFNEDRPNGFVGHSMSVSDVIVLIHNGEREVYFVDSMGFPLLPDQFCFERIKVAEVKNYYSDICAIHETSEGVTLLDFDGAWYTSACLFMNGMDLYFMLPENNPDAPGIILNGMGDLMAKDCHGFDLDAFTKIRGSLVKMGLEPYDYRLRNLNKEDNR